MVASLNVASGKASSRSMRMHPDIVTVRAMKLDRRVIRSRLAVSGAWMVEVLQKKQDNDSLLDQIEERLEGAASLGHDLRHFR